MGCIYIFFCLVDYKVYIGKCSGKRVKYRRNEHKRGEGNQLLFRAIQKHGWENFIFDTLHENVPKEMLNDLEMKEIARFHCNKSQGGWGYNLTDGGEGVAGHKQSLETRQKKSMTTRGRTAWNKGKVGKSPSAQTREKISKTLKARNSGQVSHNKGKTLSEEHRQKISKTKKGKKAHNRHPEYERARWFFFLDLANLSIKEKRQRLYHAFKGLNIAKRTLNHFTF